MPAARPSMLMRLNNRVAASREMRRVACGCSATICALSTAMESTGPRAAAAGAPRPGALQVATFGSFSATRCATVSASRSIVATAAASSKRDRASAAPPRTANACPCPARGPVAFGKSTTNLPAALAAEICVVESPCVPPKTTSAPTIGRGARCPGTATKWVFHSMGLPSTVRREWSVNFRKRYGSTWKYVPLSPPGSKPRRFTSAAIMSVPFLLPSRPTCRPSMESSAN